MARNARMRADGVGSSVAGDEGEGCICGSFDARPRRMEMKSSKLMAHFQQ